jgi:cytochrome bd-type quinol oxidase subunit 2
VSLRLRQPDGLWLVVAGAIALCVHGAVWLAARILTGDAGAVAEALRQMALALGWMACALILWKIRPPTSRLHAIASVFVCALAVTVLGSLAALARLVVIDHYAASQELLSSFTLLSLVLMIGHLVLALPAMLVMQAAALTRR